MRRVDTNKLANAASRPGIDPRRWLALAVITDLGFDATHGIFADVRYVDNGETDTALVGTCYAGNGFGANFPLHVEDTVLVAVPMGDSGWGPVIIARMWNSGDPPAPEFNGIADNNGPNPTNDVVIRVEANQNCRIIVDGPGQVLIQSRGTGGIVLEADHVLTGSAAASQPHVLGNTAKTWLSSHIHATPFGPSQPPTEAVPFPVEQILSSRHKLDQ